MGTLFILPPPDNPRFLKSPTHLDDTEIHSSDGGWFCQDALQTIHRSDIGIHRLIFLVIFSLPLDSDLLEDYTSNRKVISIHALRIAKTLEGATLPDGAKLHIGKTAMIPIFPAMVGANLRGVV